MQPNTTDPAARGVDPEELDRQIARIYGEVANEARRPLHFPTGRPLAEALGYPAELPDRLPARAVRASRHTSSPDLGGGADAAQAAREEGSTNTARTEEVSQ